jgi:acetoacetate decarboxylase
MATLHGFGNPLSPTGRAALVDPPPHHISADAIQVVFRVDPDKARAYLPDGLDLHEDALAYAYVADMVKISDAYPDQASVEPQATQYHEAILGLYCSYQGQPGRFSAFIWVTEDWSVVFGHYMGFAKKQAAVHKTKIQAANPAQGPIGPGTRLRGTADRVGRRIMNVDIELTEKIADDAVPAYGHRVYTYRHIPSPSPEVKDQRQLFALDLERATTINAWRGTGNVEIFHDAFNEDLEGFAPLEIVDAFTFQRGWTTTAGAKLLRED